MLLSKRFLRAGFEPIGIRLDLEAGPPEIPRLFNNRVWIEPNLSPNGSNPAREHVIWMTLRQRVEIFAQL
jgi:hypothetical protein